MNAYEAIGNQVYIRDGGQSVIVSIEKSEAEAKEVAQRFNARLENARAMVAKAKSEPSREKFILALARFLVDDEPRKVAALKAAPPRGRRLGEPPPGKRDLRRDERRRGDQPFGGATLKFKVIYKYPVAVNDVAYVSMANGADILSVQEQGDTGNRIVTIWALVDPTEKEAERRIFEIYGTGNQFPDAFPRKFIATVQMQGGLVWHVFERIMEAK